jgi:uncharacterized membrane protein YgcG
MMTRVSFEQSLEHCLEELSRTDDIEASLRRHPQHTDRLRPLLDMAQATRRYYDAVPEAPGGLAAGRERLLVLAAQQRARGVSATSATRSTTTRKSRKVRLVFAARLIAILLAAVMGLAALGGGAIWAADDSLPGDSLYPVKLATEDIRLALIPAPRGQVDLTLELVGKRTEEIQALAATGQHVPDETIARMERHIEYALTRTAWASDEEMTDLLTQITERIRAQVQMLEQVQATAPQQAQAGLERAVAVCQRGAEAAEDGLTDPGVFRWRYRHRQGTPGPTREPEQVTTTPEGDQEQEQEQHQQRNQERECTPVGTPHSTPQGPQATPVLRTTPHGLQPTPAPKATPQESQRTPVPPASTPQPQPLGDGHGGGGQDGDEHGGGGQDGGGQGDGREGGGGK